MTLLTISLQTWSQIKVAIQDWFASPDRVLLPLLTIFGVTLLMGTVPWRGLILKTTAGLAIAYALLISPVGAALAVAGLDHFLPVDDGRPADAIVILGRGTFLESERSQIAAQFWYQRRVPLILATGHGGEAPRLMQRLIAAGIPTTALIEEPEARTTEENALLSARLLKQKGVDRIILVTDSPHMLRSLLTFRSLGFEVIPEPIPLPQNLSAIEISQTALREYVGLVVYALNGRFRDRSNIALATAQPASVSYAEVD
jgi:uncharacterized SAM-binding protein YcdF (DUF218 family)